MSEHAFEKTGVPTPDMIRERFHSAERLKQGRVAVAECYQRIPCNPCQSACPRKAIEVGEDINNLPVVNSALCTGCGICLSKCPGLAIMVVDCTVGGGMAEISLPYEFLPLPQAGDMVTALNRGGETLCEAKVVKVQNPPSFDRTPVVTLRVEEKYLYEARGFRRKEEEA